MLMIISPLRNPNRQINQISGLSPVSSFSSSPNKSVRNHSTKESTIISALFTAKRWSLTLTSGNVAYCAVVLSSAFPALSNLFFMFYRFVFGLLYPTYRSYKALKYRNHKECARMTMYWVVFALFTSWEGILDIFVGFWFPFYSESKILFIFWLSSAYSNGAQLLYDKVVKHQFEENEQRIDRFISRARVLSLDVFYKLWCTFAVYAQQFMIFAVQRMQLALTDYVQNREEHTITSGDKFIKIMSSAFGTTSVENHSVNNEIESSFRIEEIHDNPDGNGNYEDVKYADEEIDYDTHFDRHQFDDEHFEDDDENCDPTFVPKGLADKKKINMNSDNEDKHKNEPKKVKRKRKKIVGIEIENSALHDSIENNMNDRPRTRAFLRRNSLKNDNL